MKKLVLMFIMLLTVALFSAPVSLEKAKKIAKNWQGTLKGKSTNSVTVGNYFVTGDAFYTINFADGGFVIVAADDNIEPILAYSETDVVKKDIENPAVKYWLSNYERQISYVISNNLSNIKATEKWEEYLNNDFSSYYNKSDKAVAPLIQTKWNQGDPYDRYTPNNYPVGCVATAMAQVMRYHSNPIEGAGSHSYYDTGSSKTLSANFGTTTYDWSNMTNTYGYGSSEAEKEAVSVLSYHCGVSVEMHYTSSSSGISDMTKVADALVEYFDYKSTTKMELKSNYTESAWISKLKEEIDNNRPVLYAGMDNNAGGGHSFVFSGYDNSDKFHINWGWAGSYDGYFSVNNLIPEGTGTGGNSGMYNDQQQGLFGCEPTNGLYAPHSLNVELSGRNTLNLTWLAPGETAGKNLVNGKITTIKNIAGKEPKEFNNRYPHTKAELSRYNIKINGETIATTTDKSYSLTAPDGFCNITITSVYEEGESGPSNSRIITIYSEDVILGEAIEGMTWNSENWEMKENYPTSTDTTRWYVLGGGGNTGNYAFGSFSQDAKVEDNELVYTDIAEDNWLISKELALGNKSYSISFYSSVYASDEGLSDYYEFLVTKDNGTTWDKLYSETLTNEDHQKWNKRDIDLSAYSNSNVKIAWRHYNSRGYVLLIDDIIVKSDGILLPTPKNLIASYNNSKVSLNWEANSKDFINYKIYRDGAELTTTSNTSFTDNTVENLNSYTYFVTGMYDEGESKASNSVSISVVESITLPYSNNFDSGYEGWTIKNNIEGWKHGLGTDMQSEYWNFDGNTTNLLGINSDIAGKDVHVVDYVISPVLNLTDQDNIVLSFDYKLKNGEGSYEGEMRVKYRTSLTGTWTELEKLVDAATWATHTIDIPAGAVSASTQIAFSFDDLNNWAYGAGIDNVSITSETVVPVPVFEVNISSLEYGIIEVGNSSSKSFTITNSGTASLSGTITANVDGFSIASAKKSPVREIASKGFERGGVKGTKNSISYNINANSSEIFTLSFAPANASNYSGNIVITSNDENNKTTNISVSGEGEVINAPSNLVATVDKQAVSLSWSAPSSKALKSYNIYKDDTLLEGTTATTFNETELEVGTYEYFVKAVFENGESASSNVVSATITEETIVIALDEGFEGQNSMPEGWIVYNEDGDANEWFVSSSSSLANTGTNFAAVKYNGNGNKDWLVSPLVTAGGTLSFYMKSYHANYLESFKLKVSTTGNAIEDFTASTEVISNVPTTYKKYSFDFSSYEGQNIYIAIECVSVDKYYLLVDDIKMEISKEPTDIDIAVPTATRLSQNYPNPFNPVTKINYELTGTLASSNITNYELAKIVVFNAMGQEVWSSNPSSLNPNTCTFDGSKFNSGVYYYSLIVDGKKMSTKSMVLIK